jgi:hypothetical protein
MRKLSYIVLTVFFAGLGVSSNSQTMGGTDNCDKEKYQDVCGGVADECKRETVENGVCIWYKGEW